jgi:hypothetical protein
MSEVHIKGLHGSRYATRACVRGKRSWKPDIGKPVEERHRHLVSSHGRSSARPSSAAARCIRHRNGACTHRDRTPRTTCRRYSTRCRAAPLSLGLIKPVQFGGPRVRADDTSRHRTWLSGEVYIVAWTWKSEYWLARGNCGQ